MNFFWKIIIGIAIIFGDFLLGGFLHSELRFSANKTLLIMIIAPIVLVILYFILSFLRELILETAAETSSPVSFLGVFTLKIIGVVIFIYGLYFVAQIAICIGILMLGLGFVAGLLGIGGSGEDEIERQEDEIKDLKQKRDKLPTYNGLLGGNGISESKLKYNRKLRDELDKQIQDKQRELDDM